ncbi:glycosyl transferase family 2 [Archangium gephyra]|nr:glycosyltransferase [Archangium gephyra]REG26606.1 glycosyl transferase family 2 [Archangium gephyra]
MPWLAPLRGLADVGLPGVPASHRHGVRGRLVTTAKQWVLGGLAPLQRELLAAQGRFNAALVEGLEEFPRLRELPLRTQLRELAEQATRLGLGPGAAPVAALRLSGRQVIERQRDWNRAAIELLLEASEAWPMGTEPLLARCEALAGRADVVGEFLAGPHDRVLHPLWRELMRRQVAFNHGFVQAVRRWMGGARPMLMMPAPEVYEAWWRAREPGEMAAANAALAGLERRPTISLVTPAYETPVRMLRACIESVLAQSYGDWQLCIVDDGSPGRGVERTVREYARRDSRIVFKRMPRNEGIARTTNAALALASGELIGFLDHDDTLAPHALAEVALHLEAHPETDVLYSDEDKLDEQGRRYAPYLKPGPSPELLRALNYVCHFLVVRATLLREVGGIRPGFEGAQDHDLVLRLLERTPRFARIPRVLYHWRTHPGSTAHDASAKPAASEAGRRAVEEHLHRLGVAGTVETASPGIYRVRYAVPDTPRLSVLLAGPGAPAEAELRTLLSRIDWPDWELIAVCEPDSARALEALAATEPRLRLCSPQGAHGLAARCNRAAREATGALLLFLEPGLEPAGSGWLEELASQALRPDVGVVGGTVLRNDAHLECAGFFLEPSGHVAPAFAGLPDPALTAFGGTHWPRNLLAVSGACLMVRRELFVEHGGFDEGFSEAGADADFCLRVYRTGRHILGTPHARLVRHVGGGFTPLPEQDRDRLRARAAELLVTGDPFFNPNAEGVLPGMSREGMRPLRAGGSLE